MLILIVLLIFFLISNKDNMVSQEYPKRLWMYWEQGLENLTDEYKKMCVNGWYKLNPDWDITILDKHSAIQLFPELEKFEHVVVQQRADLLRLKLLSKYGGVWADITTLPMKPLTGNIENMDNGTGIFFYRYIPPDSHNHYISNWFIMAKYPHHYLIDKLKGKFENKIKNKNRMPYWTFHDTLTELINSDPVIKKTIDALTITQSLSHAVLWNQPYPKLTKENINKHPLVYKLAKGINGETYRNYIYSIL